MTTLLSSAHNLHCSLLSFGQRNGTIGADFSTKLSAWLALGAVTARQIHAYLLAFEDGTTDLGKGIQGYGKGENKVIIFLFPPPMLQPGTSISQTLRANVLSQKLSMPPYVCP